ncbi:mechanosensitive ion channel family protein [Acetobacterium tundrae]|uniref:Mechanosensitive ion channel n=1 Tax=Acetobacterium tundrae TaxID=132932 RepID=A0ABR6WML9_9FIRM|nr:mechanosensitive ion channel family protein [Acetobacterium tundrae]MBC3797753.1 mechanosensitive ion channel [Acetobacterium tundrae]
MGYLIDNYQKVTSQINFGNLLEEILISLLVLVAAIVSIKIIFGIVNRVFDSLKSGIDVRESRRVVTLNHVAKTGVRSGIWTVAILIILGQFMDVSSLLAVAGVGTLAIGFGAQGIVEDVMSGFVIVFENQFCVGDYIIIDENHYGIVEAIGMRTTNIREFDGGLFIIHNGKIDRLKNYSKGHIKATVNVGISYEEDISKVTDILNDICRELFESHEELFKTCPEVIGVTDMGPLAVNIRISCDEDAASKFKAETVLRQKIKEVFHEKGIEIPYNKSFIYNGESDKKAQR